MARKKKAEDQADEAPVKRRKVTRKRAPKKPRAVVQEHFAAGKIEEGTLVFRDGLSPSGKQRELLVHILDEMRRQTRVLEVMVERIAELPRL